MEPRLQLKSSPPQAELAPGTARPIDQPLTHSATAAITDVDNATNTEINALRKIVVSFERIFIL